MIISASYKTDIPTFYGEWFMNRLRAGYCRVINPYGKQVYRVSLNRDDVDGIVFWTKNVAPFLRRLAEVHDRGYPFVIQHTINRYPRELETSVVHAERAIDAVRSVAESYGPRTVVWRYDTIVFSSLTPRAYHVENFGRLAEALRGVTDEVVVSFAHIYQKTKRNMDRATRDLGIEWWDPDAEEKRDLTRELLDLARANGMALAICSQHEYVVEGAVGARCVDAQRLQDVAGRRISARLKGNRKDCGCFESRDIGDYDTCPHGCVYCYAVRHRALALQRYKKHDPDSEFLYEPPGGVTESGPEPGGERRNQLKLFGD
ncbi:MAG: DUF1848 domain-containing protein [Deltaproteobacteria bacterium]|nr:MAG: DUF1848 domain-containing protein [Deltaproteobacteria bacterium]